MRWGIALYIVVAGTRPEIIKVAPIIRKIIDAKLDLYFVLTGQHYDYSLSEQMINDLELPIPNRSFELETSSPASQIAEIMTKLEKPFRINSTNNIVIVQGDTNSVLSTALTAVKLHIPIAHVEAGLRSYDWRMPEEHNRRLVDHISNVLFAPTKVSEQNLLSEHVYGQIHVTGNTVIDAVNQHLPLAEKKSEILQQIGLAEYVLATFHRTENVDDENILTNILQGLIKSQLQIVIPLHPRTRRRLLDFGLYEKIRSAKNIKILPPLGYLDFLVLMKHSRFIVTDSGGIQEEATSPLLSRRVLLLRLSSERPEALQLGITKLTSLDYRKIAKDMLLEWNRHSKKISSSPYGDGFASDRIINITRKSLVQYNQDTIK
jgi:UDP-N-acetylglucosamine 2-epimerase (non-hydrolysing)